MDVSQALADLTEISAQIEAAVIAERSGAVVAATIASEERATRFARSAADLLAAAEGSTEQGALVQLEAVLGDASVFIVPEGDRLIAAVTSPDPTVGLVFYDLKSCLRSASGAAMPAGSSKPPAPPVTEPEPAEPATAEKPAAEEPQSDAPAAVKPPAAPPPKRPRRRKKEEGDGDGAA
jgi:predicted regulator of Ras-like GTPase activity (Roadblock/LC7/MglB family)